MVSNYEIVLLQQEVRIRVDQPGERLVDCPEADERKIERLRLHSLSASCVQQVGKATGDRGSDDQALHRPPTAKSPATSSFETTKT